MELLLEEELDYVGGAGLPADVRGGVIGWLVGKGLDASVALVNWMVDKAYLAGDMSDITLYNAMGDYNAQFNGQDQDGQ